MITNPDTRGSRLERLAKLTRVDLVEDLSPMVAHQIREAARLPAAMSTTLPARCCTMHETVFQHDARLPEAVEGIG